MGFVVDSSCFLIAIGALTAFVFWQRRGSSPMLDPALFRSLKFDGVLVAAFGYYLAAYGPLVVLSLWLQKGLELSASAAALVLSIQPLAFVFVSALCGSRLQRVDLRLSLGFGTILCGIGCVAMLYVLAEPVWPALIAGLILTGVGSAMVSPVLPGAAMSDAPGRVRRDGFGNSQLVASTRACRRNCVVRLALRRSGRVRLAVAVGLLCRRRNAHGFGVDPSLFSFVNSCNSSTNRRKGTHMTTLFTPRPHRRIEMDWNRRRFLGAAAGLAAALAAAGCSRSDADAGGGEGDAGWSFTDDRGNLIELDSPPRTFVTYTGIAGALWDYGLVPVGVFGGALTRSPGSRDTSISGNLDFSKTEMVGQLWGGQVELEKIAALEPDVVIVPQLRGSALLDEANLDAVKGLSTVLFVETAAGTIDRAVQEIVELAVELGGGPGYGGSAKRLRRCACTDLRSCFFAE